MHLLYICGIIRIWKSENGGINVYRKLGIGACAVLTLMGLVSSLYGIIIRKYIVCAADVAVFAMLVYYAVLGYRKPHGNLLRYAMLLYSASLLFYLNQIIMMSGGKAQPSAVICILAMMTVVYVSGRLNKFEKNKYLMPLVFLFLGAVFAISIKRRVNPGFFSIAGSLCPVIEWADICLAYFLRYREHRDAGLRE